MNEYFLKGPISQERERIRLMAALREERFPQSIVIDGPRGIGKKALALELAKALMCTAEGTRPCGNCFGCKMILDSGATDNWVIPLESKEAHAKSAADVSARSSAKTVQDFKQEYIEAILKNPYRIDTFSSGAEISVDLIRNMKRVFELKGSSTRVVIVPEADKMNEKASNAFLKILEEVPANSYFILTTSSRDALLQTIRSRCLSLHLLPLTDSEVKTETEKLLSEESVLTDDIVGISMGSPGKALYLAEHGNSWFNLAVDFIKFSLKNQYFELFNKLKNSDLNDGAAINRFLEVLSFLIADLLRELSGAPLRTPKMTAQIDLEKFPRLNSSALNVALKTTQETMNRINTRRTSASMLLQGLAIKLFEGYK